MSKLEELKIEDSEAKESGIEGNETEKSIQFEKCNKTLHYGFQHLPLVHVCTHLGNWLQENLFK